MALRILQGNYHIKIKNPLSLCFNKQASSSIRKNCRLSLIFLFWVFHLIWVLYVSIPLLLPGIKILFLTIRHLLRATKSGSWVKRNPWKKYFTGWYKKTTTATFTKPVSKLSDLLSFLRAFVIRVMASPKVFLS